MLNAFCSFCHIASKRQYWWTKCDFTKCYLSSRRGRSYYGESIIHSSRLIVSRITYCDTRTSATDDAVHCRRIRYRIWRHFDDGVSTVVISSSCPGWQAPSSIQLTNQTNVEGAKCRQGNKRWPDRPDPADIEPNHVVRWLPAAKNRHNLEMARLLRRRRWYQDVCLRKSCCYWDEITLQTFRFILMKAYTRDNTCRFLT